MRAARHLGNGACAGILGLAVATALLAQHPGFNQIYSFGAAVGPTALTGTGNTLYGATQTDGSHGMGTVYSLTLPTTPGNPWTYTTLYEFGSIPSDGSAPLGVAIGGFSGGLPVLYGTTEDGGKFSKGTVFSLVPPQSPGGTWTEHVLHSFHGADGWLPLAPLAVDLRNGQLPVLYGTTGQGGASTGVGGGEGSGAIFSLTPPTTEGGTWTENVLYSFVPGGTGGEVPNNVVLGSGPGGAPVLYGFAVIGGTLSGGVVFSLTEASGTWTYDVIYNLPTSSVISSPTGLTIGSNGVLYGTAAPGSGADNGGQVYSLTPPTSDGGNWTENTVYSFGSVADDGVGPQCVFQGSNGNLYGVTSDGGTGGFGTVFSLTPPASPGGTWTEDVLYNFPFSGVTGGPTTLVIGPHGALYGTTSYIGGSTVSTVFAIEP
ncbi:MAG TPA: choice-of-anchor tandem repeat GloVer-containing protein [Bryobacteraceae bacterium]|nr:choice-of-anchor tandem repeat GloVer-containing protein [Bryobacteraceae bacterium]